MFVEISCKKCGQRKRMDIGAPPANGSVEEYLHLLTERLSHKPSFECFGGHFEFSPPLPQFWLIDWNTLQNS
jgi:hypothetical protein